MKRLVVVDLSNFIFRAFYAIRPMHAPDGTPTNAVQGVLSMLLRLALDRGPTHVLVARDSPGGSFRNDLHPGYKANRTEPPPDLVRQFPLVETLVERLRLPSSARAGYEADDVIGAAVVQWRDDFDEVLVASSDKDLMQFVGGNVRMIDTMRDKVYDEAGVAEKMGVRPDQIADYLAMVGDASDNVPGMRGVGAKGAAKLLAEHGTLEACARAAAGFSGKRLRDAFARHFEDGLLSRKLVRIATDLDLGMSSGDAAWRLRPDDALVGFLAGLGFKAAVKRLEAIRAAAPDSGASPPDAGDAGTAAPAGKAAATSPAAEVVADEGALGKLVGAVREEARNGRDVAVHTEYGDGDALDAELLGAGVGLADGRRFFCPAGEGGLPPKRMDELLRALWSDEKARVVSARVQRDMAHALVRGIPFRADAFDVSQALYVARSTAENSLEDAVRVLLARELPGWDGAKGAERVRDAPLAASLFAERAGALLALAPLLAEALRKESLESVHRDVDAPLAPALAAMEVAGVGIDKEVFGRLEGVVEKELAETEAEIARRRGGGEPVNLNSPRQVGDLLFGRLGLPVLKKTKTGPSTDVETLEWLDARGGSPVPGLLIRHRELSKLLSTYIRAIPDLANPRTGRVHARFHQNTAVTGRLSSSRPNLQNIPVRAPTGRRVREGFAAGPGRVLLSADYSQVELRILAHLSRDPAMLRAFREGRDIHARTAAEVAGVPLSAVTPDMRSQAKAVNFGLMYGQSSFGLARTLRIPRREARDYIVRYFERFSEVQKFLQGLKESCERTGYAETMRGRRRFLPDVRSPNRTIKANAQRMAVNSPIQGTAADVIKIAMVRIHRRLQKEGLASKMVLQVHDELVLEVPVGEADAARALVVQEMEGAADLEAPLRVDVAQGPAWSDLK